jgi:monoamine oxidase
MRCPGRFPPLNAVALGEMFELLDELTKQVRLDAPWLGPDAARLDILTAAEWADQNLTHADARLFFPLFLGEMMAADPRDVSVLHMAFYLRSGGGLRFLNAFEGGAQEERIDGGAQQLCVAMAARLGARVKLGHPVRVVCQTAAGVSVNTRAATFHGDAVIVALPPRLADSIDYQPALRNRRASVATAPGCAVKLHLIYPAPLWREQGLSGWSMNSDGPLLSTVDDSPSDGSVGVLTGFVTGHAARRFAALTPAAQRAAALAQAGRLFPELPAPIGYHATDWVNAEYSRGCYAALFGPGDWLRHGPALTRPHGRVHWAGTETSTAFFGLMEGAIRSGHRAVAEVLALPELQLAG